MKTILISDMHSNIECLRELERKEKSWDKIICLGDLVDFGLNPHEVIDWCREHGVIAVAGNHDRALSAYAASHPPLEDKMTATTFADFNRSSVTDEDIAYLDSLSDDLTAEIDGGLYYFLHVYDEKNMHIAKKALIEHTSSELFDRLWQEKAGGRVFKGKRYIVFGHSHQCAFAAVDGKRMFLNPGSLSYRVLLDGCTRGGDYLIIRDGVISPAHIDYDMSSARSVFEKLPLNDANRNIGSWLF